MSLPEGERVTLTIPRERAFHAIAHLVLGGLALRRQLTVEQLGDLQVALDELLRDGEGSVAVELRVVPGALEATIGPFDGRLRAELEQDRGGGSPPLGRVLETVADEVRVDDGDGGHWVWLRKEVGELEQAGTPE